MPVPILVVEESRDSADASSILRRAGYEVTTCSGRAALTVAKRQVPNTVVIEVSGPPDSAIRLVQRLHAHPRTCCTPVLLLPATAGGLEDGFAGLPQVTVLSCPVPTRRLLEEVQRLTRGIPGAGRRAPESASLPPMLSCDPPTASWLDPRMRRTWGALAV